MISSALRERRPLRGLIVKMPCPAAVTMAAEKFDLIVIDLEHGVDDERELSHHLALARAGGLDILVRVPVLDPAAIAHALDLGADGVVVPHVESAAEAARAVELSRYPPAGSRGWARSTPAARFGAVSPADHLKTAEGLAVVVQIESPAAAERAAEIAAVDGVTALFPGMADISVELGIPGQEDDPRVLDATRATLAAARSAGIGGMAVSGDDDTARRLRDLGASALLNVDSTLIRRAFGEAVGKRPRLEAGVDGRIPTVLVPGMLCDGAYWSGLSEALGDRLSTQVARIDLDHSIAGMAETILASAPPRFLLVGHSLGGIAALEVIRSAPDRVMGAVLISSSADSPTEDQVRAWLTQRRRLNEGLFGELVDELPAAVLSSSSGRVGGQSGLIREMARHIGRDGFRRELDAQLGRIDMHGSLGEIAVPLLVVSGELDNVAKPQLQERLTAGVAGARYAALPTAGHMSMLEDLDGLTRLVRGWLRDLFS